MSFPVAQVAIHRSQFPQKVRWDLLESLRKRQVNHKFHYDSIKQTQKWLGLHESYSPARTDPDCLAVYEKAFQSTVERLTAHRVHAIGLGCGGGQKDAQLLALLAGAGKEVFYTPSDVSTAMVLVAREAAVRIISEANCFPLVCDLATADDLPAILEQQQIQGSSRLCAFFGMIPNFEPQVILPRLASLIRRSDWLLFSANLAPGVDYEAGMRKVLPLYDNALTRDWLMTFLFDLGVDKADGELIFAIEDDSGLKKIVADFRFSAVREIQVDAQRFQFAAGDRMRLFFSYRHTPTLVRSLLSAHGLQVVDQWISKSEEEGVFLCRQ
jgi:uncharacterized SAM-dependent methyltransferase